MSDTTTSAAELKAQLAKAMPQNHARMVKLEPTKRMGQRCVNTPARAKEEVTSMDPKSNSKTCSIDGCDNPLFARQWCSMHYSRWYRAYGAPPRPSPEHRFWEKIDKSGNCWIWTAAVDDSGYGRLIIDRKVYKAHRFSWELHNGPIPDGLQVLHDCRPSPDNPACVNPTHLWLGTHADNMRDMADKGHAQGYSSPGESHPSAKLTEDDIREIRRLYDSGDHTLESLGSRFGVTFSNVGMIVRRDTWSHVE